MNQTTQSPKRIWCNGKSEHQETEWTLSGDCFVLLLPALEHFTEVCLQIVVIHHLGGIFVEKKIILHICQTEA